MFSRKKLSDLRKWRASERRKPLIIRGARQVGKSTLIREFAKEYDHYIELNLEKQRDASYFDMEGVQEIVDAIFLSNKIQVHKDQEVLLFIDEIQEVPAAIQWLRYFFEEVSWLHVVAAGSLLEFALGEVKSFPVGRVQQQVLHPFDFEEYLLARGNKRMVDEISKMPVANHLHDIMLKEFHEYVIVGGMPEVIKEYDRSNSFSGLSKVYEEIWQTYKDDIPKYGASRSERNVLQHLMETAPFEQDRITMGGFGNSNYKAREVGEGLRALDKSRVIQLIYPITGVSLPVTLDLKRKPRLQFLDTGLLNFVLGNHADLISVNDLSDFHRGRIIQHVVYQQVQVQNDTPGFKPHFWVRENSNSNAEVDLVIPFKKHLIPVEVKSGKVGRLRSLHQFMERCNHPYAVRLSANKLLIEEVKTPAGHPFILMNLPYYLCGQLEGCLEWFITQHPIK